jgi:hypothetical protein
LQTLLPYDLHRVVFTLLVAAMSAQALYIFDVLYAWEFEKSHDVAVCEFSKRGLEHLNVVRDIAFNNEETVLVARGNEKQVRRSQ